ncbi:Methyltransferase Nsun7-Like [Manis pentadactyla]|nr:Methyltransferase Nsun7-Like [Manis pentadactyla]
MTILAVEVKDSTSTCRARMREEHFALAQKAVEIEHLEQVGTNLLLSPCLMPAALCAWDTMAFSRDKQEMLRSSKIQILNVTQNSSHDSHCSY